MILKHQKLSRSIFQCYRRSIFKTISLAGLVVGLSTPAVSFAIPVQVDWNASIVNTSLGLGSGTLSGSLGTFDVSTPGETFVLPADSSLSINASGFTSGFPNGSYALTSFLSSFGATDLLLQFDQLGPGFVVSLIPSPLPSGGAFLTTDLLTCTVGVRVGGCRFSIGAFDDGTTQFFGAAIDIAHSGINESAPLGQMNFSFLVEPVAVVPVPAAVWLFGTALIGLVGFSKRKSRIAT